MQVESTIEYICRHESEGAILVFLTGWDDISKLLDKVKANRFLGDPGKFMVLPLHGSMPTINQREIFDRPPLNKRRGYYQCCEVSTCARDFIIVDLPSLILDSFHLFL